MPNERRSSDRTASSPVEEAVAPCSELRFRCGVAVSGRRAVMRHPPASSAEVCSAWFGLTPVWRWDRRPSPACDWPPRARACSRPARGFDGNGRPQVCCAWSHTLPAILFGNSPETRARHYARGASAMHQRQPRILPGQELLLKQQKRDRARTDTELEGF